MDSLQVSFWGFVVQAEGFRSVVVEAVLVVLLVVILARVRRRGL
jgi:hypothetical protein